MGKQVLTINEFNTVLCKVEGIQNSRPIIGSDISEGKRIKPFKLLIGKEELRAPMIDGEPYSDTGNMRTKLVSKVCGRFEKNREKPIFRAWRPEINGKETQVT
jgi:hypothetical protein